MALDTKIVGSTSGNGAEVNASNQLKITAETNAASNPGNVGAIRSFVENDAGAITGTADLTSPEASGDYRLRVGMDTLLMSETFNGTIQNTSLWSYTFATLTASIPSAGYLQFGTVQGTTNAHGAFLRSFQYFPLHGTAPLYVEFTKATSTSALVANEVWLMGLGLPTAAVTIPTDGVWVKETVSGVELVIAYNTVLTSSGVLTGFTDTLGTAYKYAIEVGEREVNLWRNDVKIGSATLPVVQGQPFMQGALPVFRQKYNIGNVSNTSVMRVSDITVSLGDLNTSKPWPHQMTGQGWHATQYQNGASVGPTTVASSSAPAAAAAVVQATAAAQFTGLGGVFRVLPTLTSGTGGLLSSLQNPAGTVNVTGRKLFITGIRIQSIVEVALTGGPLMLVYSACYGHTAVSLLTAETASFATATTKKPRYVPLGIESYAATAALGTLSLGPGINVSFQSPLCVNPGEFFAIELRNYGTVTTVGNLLITVTPDGYWE